jgi:hypothetical protein
MVTGHPQSLQKAISFANKLRNQTVHNKSGAYSIISIGPPVYPLFAHHEEQWQLYRRKIIQVLSSTKRPAPYCT